MVNVLQEADVLEKAALFCLSNAKQYANDADILCSFRSYGHSLLFTVLSDVELGRAVIYNLWSKGLISEDMLPSPFQSYFREKQYGILAAEAWWIGLVIASNIEELVQNLLDVSEIAGESFINEGELSAPAKNQITEIVERMGLENSRLMELEKYLAEGSFVSFSLKEAEASTPTEVKGLFVRERLNRVKKRIRTGEPFFALSLTDTPKKIAKLLLEEAFQSILPLRLRISQFTSPIQHHFNDCHYPKA